MTIYIIGICNVSIISSHDKNKERKCLLNPILRNKSGYPFKNDSVMLCYCIFLSMTVLLRGIEWSLRACEQSVVFIFSSTSIWQAVAKILRARPSEHPSNFCEQFEQRPNFASTFKLNETILYPLATLSKHFQWRSLVSSLSDHFLIIRKKTHQYLILHCDTEYYISRRFILPFACELKCLNSKLSPLQSNPDGTQIVFCSLPTNSDEADMGKSFSSTRFFPVLSLS